MAPSPDAPLTPCLQASHLVKTIKRRTIVSDVSFTVRPGEVVALLGPNGAGKTTSFYMVAGVIAPDSGDVSLNGLSLNGQGIHERARQGLGYLPQESSVFRRLSVWENIMLVLEFQPGTPKEHADQCRELLNEFGLLKLKDKAAIQLSGGERRRVEIARALATRPKYILLDEPFTGIDPITIEDLQSLILQLTDRGLGVLITDHNPTATLRIADRGYILFDGQVMFSGNNREIAESDLVRSLYLGQEFQFSA